MQTAASIIPLFLAFIISISSSAQTVNLQLYTTHDGLKGNNVAVPVQDDRGIIWILSGGTLQKFDGKHFFDYPERPVNLKGAEEMLTNVVLFRDSLLLFASDHFLFLLNPRFNTWKSYELDSDYYFHHFIFAKDGLVCFEAFNEKNQLSRSFWMFRNEKLMPFEALNNRKFESESRRSLIYSMEMDVDSNFFVIHENQIIKISPQGDLLKTLTLPFPRNRINQLAFYPSGELLLLHDCRFFTIDSELDLLNEHPANRFFNPNQPITFHDLSIQENGSFWACGSDALIYYDAVKDILFDFHAELEKEESVLLWGMMEDNTGTLWLETEKGFLKANFNNFPFQAYFKTQETAHEEEQTAYSFRGITEDDDGIIYGAYYIGIAVINPKNKSESLIEDIEEFLPFDLRIKKDLLYLNDGNIFHLPTQKKQQIPGATGGYSSDNGVFVEDDSGDLWRAVYDTLYFLDATNPPGSWVPITSLPMSSGANHSSAEASCFSENKKKIILGISDQLFVFDPVTNQFNSFDTDHWKIPIRRIMAIEEDREGNYWLGTDIGLVHFSPESKATNLFTTRDGLCNDFVCGILAEGDTALWLSTNMGLSRFDLNTRQFVNFYEEDGLSDNEFNRMSSFKAKDGRMYFGGITGLNAFYPEEVMKNYRLSNEKAKMILSAFKKVDEKRDTNILQTTFDDHPTFHLYHWDRSFEFQFLLTDYSKPDEVQYAYRMEGYEDHWSSFSEANSIRFSSLPVGKYSFQVKARDHRGVEHPSKLNATVIVHPPWWETWWAYSVYFLIIAGVTFTIVRFVQQRWLLKQTLKKEKEEAIRLKELDEFKSRLYTNLTHEFRTPLTVILGMTEQVETNPKDNFRQGLALIRKNGKQLLQLINQLLDLSKLENKVLELKLEQGNIISYLQYLTSSFESFARINQLGLRFYAEPEEVIMDYDPEQIKQLLTNLISNALKFTPVGGQIEVTAGKVDQNLVIKVKDTGIGIPEDSLPLVFDRFYQVDNSSARKNEGTGIGLAHTRELVHLMKGSIEVESNVNNRLGETGTQFQVSLPIVVSPNTPTTETPEPLMTTEPSFSSPDTNPSLPLLLIVEDHPDVVAYLKSCLQNAYQIEVASNGVTGFEKAINRIPDLIISDVMMPKMNGFELCDRLKKDERTSHIPIILLTARADMESKMTGLEKGADAYLYKPFNKKELLLRVDMMVKKQKQLIKYFSKKFQGGLAINVESQETSDLLPLENAFIIKVRNIVEQHYSDEHFAVPQLAEKVNMSRSQLYRKMKALIDTSPSDFIRNYRLGQAKQLLQEQDLTVSEVAWKVGYKEIAHFSKSFQQAFGFNPSSIS